MFFIGSSLASENVKSVPKTSTIPKLNCLLPEELKRSPSSKNRYYSNFSELKSPPKNTYILSKQQRLSLERVYNTPMLRNSVKYEDNYDFGSCLKTFMNNKSRLGRSFYEGKYSQSKHSDNALKVLKEKIRANISLFPKTKTKSNERKKSSPEKSNRNDKSFLFLPLIHSRPANLFKTSLTQGKKKYKYYKN